MEDVSNNMCGVANNRTLRLCCRSDASEVVCILVNGGLIHWAFLLTLFIDAIDLPHLSVWMGSDSLSSILLVHCVVGTECECLRDLSSA